MEKYLYHNIILNVKIHVDKVEFTELNNKSKVNDYKKLLYLLYLGMY